MIKNRVILLLLLCFSLSGCGFGRLSKEAVWLPYETKAQALKDLAEIERQKLELEKQKFELEKQKQEQRQDETN